MRERDQLILLREAYKHMGKPPKDDVVLKIKDMDELLKLLKKYKSQITEYGYNKAKLAAENARTTKAKNDIHVAKYMVIEAFHGMI